MTIRSTLVTSVLALGMILASSAIAQSSAGDAGGGRRNKPKADSPADPKSGDQETVDPGVLAGPAVEDEAEKGANSPMTSPNNVGRRRAASDQNIPLRQWLEAVRSVGLSDVQQQEVAAIAAEFQTALREYQARHADEMRRLQQQVRAARESGNELDPSVREQLQKLEAGMPKQVDCQQRIWEKLSTEQQSAARAKLAQLEKRRLEQRRAGGNAGAAGQSPAPTRTPNGVRPSSDSTGESLSPSGQDQRNVPMSTPDGGSGADEMSGSGMTDAPRTDAASERPRAAAAAAARRRGDGGGIDIGALDQSARRRVDFLLSRLSATRAGNGPTADEKTFRFNENEAP